MFLLDDLKPKKLKQENWLHVFTILFILINNNKYFKDFCIFKSKEILFATFHQVVTSNFKYRITDLKRKTQEIFELHKHLH